MTTIAEAIKYLRNSEDAFGHFAEIAELLESMQWQSIETAPKDGTMVDLWIISRISGASQRICDLYWQESVSDWMFASDHAVLSDHFGKYKSNYRPVYWMPPPPPRSE